MLGKLQALRDRRTEVKNQHNAMCHCQETLLMSLPRQAKAKVVGVCNACFYAQKEKDHKRAGFVGM